MPSTRPFLLPALQGKLDDFAALSPAVAGRIEEPEETLLTFDGRPGEGTAAFDLPSTYWHRSATPGMIENI